MKTAKEEVILTNDAPWAILWTKMYEVEELKLYSLYSPQKQNILHVFCMYNWTAKQKRSYLKKLNKLGTLYTKFG